MMCLYYNGACLGLVTGSKVKIDFERKQELKARHGGLIPFEKPANAHTQIGFARFFWVLA